MVSTTNKNYPLQATGTNIGTWGTVLNNGALSVIDNNLGGTLNISVAGSADVNLTASQASFLIHNLTGALTGNINYIFPKQGGFFAINNQTTGAFTLTVSVVGGTGGIVVLQGTTVTIYVDASVPQVEALSGTQFNFITGPVTGTANALVVTQTFPSGFSLNNGTLITFTPNNFNTGAATLQTPDGSIKPIQKINYFGIVDLVDGDMANGLPVFAQYNGSVWIGLNIPAVGYENTVSTNQNVVFGDNFTPYVNTAPITYTIDPTNTLLTYWYVDINALGGPATIKPNAADTIHVNGTALATGASFILNQGSTCRLITDANGNLYVNFNGSFSLDSIASTQGDFLYRNATVWTGLAPGASGQLMQTGGAGANPAWSSALINGITAATQAANDSSTLVATTAFVNPANSLGTNGYQKFASGLILQWGRTTVGPSSGTSITFPVAFSSACYAAVATETLSSPTSSHSALGVSVAPGTSSFTVYNTNTVATVTADWFAVGV